MNHLTTSAPCLVCGVQHTACGPVADVVPVDIPRTEVRTLSEVRLYEVTVNGYETRMRLNEADAKDLGATPVTDAAPADTAEDPADGGGTDADDVPEALHRRARKAVPNRARTAADNK